MSRMTHCGSCRITVRLLSLLTLAVVCSIGLPASRSNTVGSSTSEFTSTAITTAPSGAITTIQAWTLTDPFCLDLWQDTQAICRAFGPNSPECASAQFNYYALCGDPSLAAADDERCVHYADALVACAWLRARVDSLPDGPNKRAGRRFCRNVEGWYARNCR